MPRILFAFLLLSLPLHAQTFVSPYSSATTRSVSGTLTSAEDTVTAMCPGQQWADARITISGTWTGKVLPEETIDGTNWIPTAYAKNVSTVAASPTVGPSKKVTPDTGAAGDGAPAFDDSAAHAGTWEVPLRGNSISVRARFSTASSGSVTATVACDTVFVPGVATLYEVTSATNTALNTGILETSGWTAISYRTKLSGGVPAFAVNDVNDAGTATALVTGVTTAFQGGLGGGQTVGGTVAGVTLTTALVALPRRISMTSAAVAAQTTGIHIEARR